VAGGARRTHVFEDPRLEITSSLDVQLDTQARASSTELAIDRTKALSGALPALPPMAEGWEEGPRRLSVGRPFILLSRPTIIGTGAARAGARGGEAVGVQAFFQLGVALGVRLGAEIGIRGLRLFSRSCPSTASFSRPPSPCWVALTLSGHRRDTVASTEANRFIGHLLPKTYRRAIIQRLTRPRCLRFGRN